MRVFVAHASPLLTDHLPHGDGLAAWELIRRLAARGHRLDVAVEAADLNGPVPENVALHPVGSRPGVPAALRSPGLVTALRSLYTRLRSVRPYDVVHQLNPVDAGLSLSLLGLEHPPIVLGPYVGRWPQPRGGPLTTLRSLARWAVVGTQQSAAAAVLHATEFARTDQIRPLPWRRPETHLVPLGIDTGAQRVGRAPGPTERVVQFVGRMDESKGFYDLLEAWGALPSPSRAWQLRLTGPGADSPRIREALRRLPEGASVTLTGAVSPAEAQATIASSDIVCVPSHGEPFGRVALEAMAHAKPLVVTDSGGLAELPAPGGALLVAAGDADALRTALHRLLVAPPEELEAMGARNRARAESHLDWEVVVDEVERVYEALRAPVAA